MYEADAQPSDTKLVEIIKSTYLFESFDESVLTAFLADATILHLAKEKILYRQGDSGDHMCIVINGLLKVTIKNRAGLEVQLLEIGPGEPVGEIQLLTGGTRTANVYALQNTTLLQITKAACDRIAREYPEFIDEMTELIRWRLRRNQLVSVLPGVFGPLDAATLKFIEDKIEWVFIARDDVLFRKGDIGDNFFILISGRLMVVIEDQMGNEKKKGYMRPGESVGEMAIIMEQRRPASILAVRDSELVMINKKAFDLIVEQYPLVAMHFMKIFVHRLQKSISFSQHINTVMNIAVVPAGPDVPLSEFTRRLEKTLAAFGSVLYLSSEHLDKFWSMQGMSQAPTGDPKHIRLSAWLDEQETNYRYILYQTDFQPSSWTARCLQQADHVLIVGQASASPEPSEIEIELFGVTDRITRTASSLILLHPDGNRPPEGTRRWMATRQVEHHHHVRWDRDADFSRIARFLTGSAVGLVLGGGGARAFAHLGVIRAIEEAGIPIDMICGTSMGALVAGVYALGWDHETRMQNMRKSFLEVNPIGDYTFPTIAIVKSRRLDHYLRLGFGDHKIEDLWLNYFCISSNLTTAEIAVHEKGTLWKAIRSSISVPGILKPVLKESCLLVDGAVINNLPADIMRERFDGFIITVNVTPEKDLTIPETFQKIPSSWEYLWSRINPLKKAINFPTIIDIMMRTTMLASINQTSRVRAEADYYFKPQLHRFGMLDFKALEDIVEVAYEYAKQEIEEWRILTEEIWEVRLNACLEKYQEEFA